MPNLNKAMVIGHLGHDPELRTAGKTEVCKFSVAATEKYKDKETTTWFRVAAWDKLAETCNKYLKKGSLVYVEGRIQTGSYENKEGATVKTWELIARTVQFLSGRPPAEDNDDIPF